MIPLRANPHIQKLSDFAKAAYQLGCFMEDNDPELLILFSPEFIRVWKRLETFPYESKARFTYADVDIVIVILLNSDIKEL